MPQRDLTTRLLGHSGDRLALVVGATGAQGGSVARALRGHGWAVRALTRNPGSAAAERLAAAGVHVVAGDLGAADHVRDAVTSVDALFLVTDYWSLGAEREYEYGRRTVDLALAAGAGHVVVSSLPEATERTGGELALPHHDGKARLETELRRRNDPVTFVHLSTYYENWPNRRLRRAEDGSWSFVLPYGDQPLPAIAVEDLGELVRVLLDGGAAWFGHTVKLVGDLQPPGDYARILTDMLGVPVRYRHVPYERFRRLPISNAGALADMLEYSRRYDRNREDDLLLTRRLYPAVRSFAEWVEPARFPALFRA